MVNKLPLSGVPNILNRMRFITATLIKNNKKDSYSLKEQLPIVSKSIS